MHIVLAPEAFPGHLTAVQAALAMAAGWSDGAPHDTVLGAPLSDGGLGFAGLMAQAGAGTLLVVTVADALGRPVHATMALTEHEGRTTAWVEAAQAVGSHLLGVPERNPGVTSSRGVGQLLQAARAAGASRVVVGVGDVACHDGGAGLLAELGCEPAALLDTGGQGLGALGRHELRGLRDVREQWRQIELVLATDDLTPLLGFSGTSATQAEARGADRAQAQLLETCLGTWMDAVTQALPPSTDLLSAAPRRWDREPGSGAGGGLGFALLALGAHRLSPIRLGLEAWGVPTAMAGCDLVVTARGVLDGAALRHGALAQLAPMAQAAGVPTMVIAQEMIVGRRDLMGVGVTGIYTLTDSPAEVQWWERDSAQCLSHRIARLARTWSPSR